jgi:hypothetical protein
MHEPEGNWPYLAAKIQEALAQDPRVGELGIHVEVDADEIRVSGDVSTPERQEAIRDVVREIAQGHRLSNATSVTSVVPQKESEVLP